MIVSLLDDIRHFLRQLRRSPGYAGAVVLTLALGIGLNAAIFSMVDGVLLRPLGYRDADRIYSLNTRFVQEARSIPRMGGGDYVDVQHRVSSLEHVAYYQAYQDGLQIGRRSLYLNVANVSPQFGQVLGVEPVAGRTFIDAPDGQEAMVAASFAREQFGSEIAALGQTLNYDSKPRVIVGVLPDHFSFPGKTTVWIEASAIPEIPNRTAYNQRVIGKTRPGVTGAMLNAELATFSRQLAAAYPEDKLKALEAVSLQDQIVGGIRPTLSLLMASVALVLLIVCSNVTHLQLVRSTRSRREISIRTALGATRLKLARQAAVEVLLLAVMGCAAGILLAVPALRLLVVLAPADIPRLDDVRLNVHVVEFSFALSLLTMTITALLPLWRAWKIDPASAMKEDNGRGTEGRRSGHLRKGLVVAEVSLTMLLSVAALLLGRQLIAESQRDLGFRPDHLVVLDTHAPRLSDTNSTEARMAALDEMLDSVRAVPGVQSVAAVRGVPMGSGTSSVMYAVRGVSEFKPGAVKLPDADIAPITPGYFETMHIPLLKGRALAATDRSGNDNVLVISKAMAAQSFANVEPIGQQIMCGYDRTTSWWTIVGVVGDVRQDSPGSAPYPTIYVPFAQHPGLAGDIQVLVRTQTDEASAVASLERHFKQHYPSVAVSATTMPESVGEARRPQRFRTVLFASFAGISILLAMIGIYGVTAYTVTLRSFEFALRFALGAQRAEVLGMVVRGALAPVAAGLCLGLALSAGLMRVVGSLVGKMPAFDLIAYAGAVCMVLGVTLAATLPSAFRASYIDPMQTLRND